MASKEKSPERWDEVIIRTPNATLTKRDVANYYANPRVRRQLLRAAGKGETLIRQNFSPEKSILRRKDPRGNLIRIAVGDNYDRWNQMRMTEVHPAFGRRTQRLVADIDPRERVPWEKTKAIAETVAREMKQQKDVKNVGVRFSGGRGFYVEGDLRRPTDVDRARRRVREVVHGISQRPDVTTGVPRPNQIRIDTTPVKQRGSIRAPFSINAQTGLVSLPVSFKELPNVKKQDFTIERAKKEAADADFAPGIPSGRRVVPIPEVRDKAWDLAVQLHKARRAGPHYDLRFVDPATSHAHSFAVPKARLPSKKDRMLLAIQQPTHRADYALNFEGTIPEGQYGAGEVTMPIKERVQITRGGPRQIRFRRGDQEYVLFRTEGNRWGFKRLD